MKLIEGNLVIGTQLKAIFFYEITRGNQTVGIIRWDSALQQWLFEPAPGIVFIPKSLQNIARAISKLQPMESSSYSLAAEPENPKP